MKPIALLITLVSSACLLPAQRLSHALGVNYVQSFEAYGNADIASCMYTPQLQWEKGSFVYGLAAPMYLGRLISRSREKLQRLVVEVPVSAELSFNPAYPCSAYENLGVFAGAGVSRLYDLGAPGWSRDMANTYLGFRVKHVEMRFNLGRALYSNAYKAGFGLSFLFG